MQRRLILSIVLSTTMTVCLAGCRATEETEAEHSEPLRGGVVDASDMYPFVVLIAARLPGDAVGQTKPEVCTGTLITCRDVLTAAHCVCNRPFVEGEAMTTTAADCVAEVDVRFDRYDPYSSATFRGDVEVFPRYARRQNSAGKLVAMEHDLAVVHLRGEPPTTPDTSLATDVPTAAASVTLVGYGDTSCEAPLAAVASRKRRVGINFIDSLELDANFPNQVRILADAADEANAEVDALTLHGDSGGPLLLSEDALTIIGVASNGDCDEPGEDGLEGARYTRVDVDEYRTWLASTNTCFPCQLQEVCGNGEDDNCNGLVDCDDDECSIQPGCCGDEGDPCCSVGSACNQPGLECSVDGFCLNPSDPCFGVACPDDGDLCNGPEACVDGECISGPTLECTDEDECYPASGCGCPDGDVQTCPYSGPPESIGVGVCTTGVRQCSAGAFGECINQILPSQENCDDGLDNDCNGLVDYDDPACSCHVGDLRPCYVGPAGTERVGLCSSGVQQCVSTDAGYTWTGCLGQTVPAPQDCLGPFDNDCDGECGCEDADCAGHVCNAQGCLAGDAEECDGEDNDLDGQVDEDDPEGGATCATGRPGICGAGHWHCIAGELSCVQDTAASDSEVCGNSLDDNCNGFAEEGCGSCTPGEERSCYTGPVGTDGNGVCARGEEQCWFGGVWSGFCTGEVLPQAELCNGVDDDCNGTIDNGCGECSPGATRVCYSGPDGTLGIGECHGGMQSCDQNGEWESPCVSDATPAVEACNLADDDCDGAIDNDVDCVYDVIVRCDPPVTWTVDSASYWIVPEEVGPWDVHVGDLVDEDPGPAFETRVALQPGERLEITHHLTDAEAQERWSCDFGPPQERGSGMFGVPQCEILVDVNGVDVALEFVENPVPNQDCIYTNLSVRTPTAPTPSTLCP